MAGEDRCSESGLAKLAMGRRGEWVKRGEQGRTGIHVRHPSRHEVGMPITGCTVSARTMGGRQGKGKGSTCEYAVLAVSRNMFRRVRDDEREGLEGDGCGSGRQWCADCLSPPLSAGAQVTNSVRRVCLPTSESIKCLASIHSMQVTNSPQCR